MSLTLDVWKGKIEVCFQLSHWAIFMLFSQNCSRTKKLFANALQTIKSFMCFHPHLIALLIITI